MDYLGENIWQILQGLGTVGAAVLALFALRQARDLFQSQRELSQTIHQEQQRLSRELNRQQMALAQRQLFIPLFDQLKDIATIDPHNPIWPDVTKAVNFLELLGVCWEGQLVDEDILLRVFREFVLDTFDRIKRCDDPPPQVGKDGETMLRESRAATSLYNHLLAEHINRDLPRRIE